MDINLDLRGLSCPQPVIKTKMALDGMKEGILRVIVDNSASFENVKRFAEGQGCEVKVEEVDGEFKLEIVKAPICEIMEEDKKKLLQLTAYIDSDTMGRGSDELGKILMRAFLKTLPSISPEVTKIIFVNNGVHITTEGSDLIETLKDLETKGMEIYSCGTCLDYFHLLDKVKVGRVSNMYEIITMLANSDRVIKP